MVNRPAVLMAFMVGFLFLAQPAAAGDLRWWQHGAEPEPEPQSSAAGPMVTLTISRNTFFAKEEAYDINQEAQDLGSAATGSSGVSELKFYLKAPDLNYSGRVKVLAPTKLEISMDIQAGKAFRLRVYGIAGASATDNGAAMDLGRAIAQGTHTVKITGVADKSAAAKPAEQKSARTIPAAEPVRTNPEEQKTAEASVQAAAFRAYIRAVASGDFAAVKKCVSAEVSRSIESASKDPEAMSQAMEILKAMTPQDVRFLAVKADGASAELVATGKSMDGQITGTISLGLEGGVWKVGKQKWNLGKRK